MHTWITVGGVAYMYIHICSDAVSNLDSTTGCECSVWKNGGYTRGVHPGAITRMFRKSAGRFIRKQQLPEALLIEMQVQPLKT